MQRLSIAALVAASVVLFGCPSQQELCREGVDQVCERVHECQPEQVRATEQFQAGFGTSVDNCKELLYQNPLRPQQRQGVACADVETNEQLCANAGFPGASNFDLSNSQSCRTNRDKLSCEEYLAQLADPTLAPSPCNERCSP